MDGFRKGSPFASMATAGGGSDQSNFRAEQQQQQMEAVVFGSGGFGATAAAAASKRGRERPRSQSPNTRAFPLISNQDTMKAFGKSPTEQQSEEDAAKARRLLRFGAELGTRTIADDEESTRAAAMTADLAGSRKSSPVQSKFRDNGQAVRMETATEHAMETDAPDNLQWTLEPILGVCPDMCPEAERNERERKGDLDRFERVGGSRNQTTRDLAVKKYTRTPERDAVLIRPLSVLKGTMRYLLSLLEREHEDDLLQIHGFLWDRMRAVRMDLRMQHIFTEEAIVMHEQMIRFHILAMHELCEYSPGEGITDVFNAHLNIEQMNKASVDLFQMYEDHAKRGKSVRSEPEFRGYYALLKLDKHPGYRVEPAELSLDLAKMTPEIRNSQQVRFARDVARACRASNFVAFFRLAREATYLQACLMHAHFSKLRTQAFASLHSGLQRNQGIPVSTLIDWLGMEGEDIQALVAYHGFSIKYFEKAYVVKDGPFLNKNQAFPTSRAKLVESKRSSRIVMDVRDDGKQELKTQIGGMVKSGTIDRNVPTVALNVPIVFPVPDSVGTKEEEMPDYVEELGEGESEEIEVESVAPVLEVTHIPEVEQKLGKKRRMEVHDDAEEHEIRRVRHEIELAAIRKERQAAAVEKERQEELLRRARHTAEANAGKLSSWFRKWRRRAAAKALESRQKFLETEEALDALSLGYPLWTLRVLGESVNLYERKGYADNLVKEQALTLQDMWDPIDVPSLVGPVLQGLNPLAGFLYWKLLFSTVGCQLGQWVRMKVKGKAVSEQDFVNQSSITLADESMVLNQDGRVVEFRYAAEDVGPTETIPGSNKFRHGIGGLIFVVDESKAMSVERARLHAFIQTLPDGANAPLLVLSGKPRFDKISPAGLAEEDDLDQLLKVAELDRSKIIESRIVSLAESSRSASDAKGYYHEAAMREGLVWLAKLSPRQPALRSLHVADLVWEHLDTRSKLLFSLPFTDVSPNWCIRVLNEGVQNAADEIVSVDPVCPKVSSSSVSAGAQWTSKDDTQGMSQPKRGWDTKKALDSICANLESCCLPTFPPVDLESNSDNITLQKLKVEQSLFQFLSLSSPSNLANTWEVSKMVQRGCTVQWFDSGRKLVPKWGEIFQSILASRLLLLNMIPLPLVYIARTHDTPLRPYKIENGNSDIGIAVQPVSYHDGQLLLKDVIGDELYCGSPAKEPPSASERIWSSVPHTTLATSRQSTGELCSMENGVHEILPQHRSLARTFTDEDALQDALHFGFNGEQTGDRGALGWIRQRTEERRSQSLQLPCTESESSLNKMVEDLKQRQFGPVEDVQVRDVDHRRTSQVFPSEVHGFEHVEHQWRDGAGREDGYSGLSTETFQAGDHISRGNDLIASSPFEVLLDKMVVELRLKGSNPQY